MHHYPPFPWDLLVVTVVLILAIKIGQALCIAAKSLGRRESGPSTQSHGVQRRPGNPTEHDLARTIIPVNSRIWEDSHNRRLAGREDDHSERLLGTESGVLPIGHGGADGDEDENG